MNQTTVVNIKHSQYDVLIDRTTIFGNPFPVWKWGREGCLKKFESYFWQRIERDPEWKAEVLKLKGKVVGCHCKPLSCHGDTYADYLNSYDEVERCRITAILESVLERINDLATCHGWYEPELQGEVMCVVSEIDNPDMRAIIAEAAEGDSEYDVIGAVERYVREC